MTRLIDTHCHLNFHAYDEDRETVIQNAAAEGVTRIIIPATDLKTGHQAIALVQQYAGIFAAVGIHPNSTADFAEDQIETIRSLADEGKVVAIGEIGLDYYWDKSPKAAQLRAFEAQLELAAQLELPVIIHNREASEDVMAVLENWVADLPESLKHRPGVMHSFSAPEAVAERAIAIGFYLGFTGPLTYKNAEELRRIAARIPEDRILVETDGPFLAPTPYRGKRNEPAYIPHILERLASLRTKPADEIGAITTENAVRLFQLPE